VNTTILGTGSYLPACVLSSSELGDRLGVCEQWIIGQNGNPRNAGWPPRKKPPQTSPPRAAQQALDAADLDAGDNRSDRAGDPPPRIKPIPGHRLPGTGQCRRHPGGGLRHRRRVQRVRLRPSPWRHALLLGRPGAVDGAGHRRRHPTPGSWTTPDRRTGRPVRRWRRAPVVLGKTTDRAGVLASTPVLRRHHRRSGQDPGRRQPDATEQADRRRGRTLLTSLCRAATCAPGHQDASRGSGDLLDSTALSLSDVDLIVPHQANGVMLADLASSLDLAPGIMHLTVDRYGNTGAGSVPITLDDAVRHGRIGPGATLLLVASAAG